MSLVSKLIPTDLEKEVQGLEAGTVESHSVAVGASVARYDELLTLSNDEGGLVVSSPYEGTVTMLAPVGATIVAGGKVARIKVKPDPNVKPKPHVKKSTPLVIPPPHVRRNDHITPMRESEKEPLGGDLFLETIIVNDAPPQEKEVDVVEEKRGRGRPRKAGGATKTNTRNYSIPIALEKAIKKKATHLREKRKVENMSESELVRIALRMVLALPEPVILAMVRDNRANEISNLLIENDADLSTENPPIDKGKIPSPAIK